MHRVLIVDDHPLVRSGIVRALSEGVPGAAITEAGSAPEALEHLWKHSCDLVLLDISLPGMNGLDLLKQIKSERPELPVLVLSIHDEDQFAVRALRNGAAGYLTKNTPVKELIAAVKTAMGGRKYIHASLAEKLATHLERGDEKPPHEALSDREFEVLRMIGLGKTVSEIAEELSLSVKTISTYRGRLLEKTALRNNSQLVRYAMEHRLV